MKRKFVERSVVIASHNRGKVDEISKLHKEVTILIIAHRVDTLRNCNKIIRFCKNNQIRVGTYQELINS